MTFEELCRYTETATPAELAEAFSWTDATKATSFRGSGTAMFGSKYATGVVPNTTTQMAANANDRNQEMAKALNTLPFPLDRLQDKMVEAYISLNSGLTILLHAYRNGILNTAEKKLMKEKIALITKLMGIVETI